MQRRPRITSSVLPALVALAIGAGACTADDTSTGSGTTPTLNLSGDEITLTSGLETFQSCDALLERLQAEGSERVGPYGFGQGDWFGPVFANDEESVDTAETTEAAASDSDSSLVTSGAVASERGATDDASDTSETNNQESGVDEADLVKTDGDRLVVVLGNTLRVIDLATDTIDQEVDLGETYYGGELFLTGDSAIVMSTGWTEQALGSATRSLPHGATVTRLAQVNLGSGEITRTLEFEGSYLSAREIDGTLRIAVWAGVADLGFVYPSNDAALEQAEKNNREVVEGSTIDQWLPSYRLSDADGEIASGSLVDCERMFVPSEFAGFGTLSILTIDGSSALDPIDATAVLSDGQTVYASTDRMAIATARWPEFDDSGQSLASESYHTLIHTFDITDPTATDYVASGSVDGHLLNQYSLSSHDGFLRVATTAGNPWDDGQNQSESFITVLAENGQSLEAVGTVGGIGEGEQIYAVRFMGDMAYVVTFKQVDPLYAIDLSDPANPTVLGELKIPGFSSYLHPVADGLLLGVGQDGTDDGRITGSQASLFDVSDPTNPQRIDQISLGDQAFSSVEWDAKAFTWWEPTTTGFIPVSWHRYDNETGSDESGTASIAVTVDGRTLVESGRIEHDSNRQCEGDIMPVEEFDSADAEASLVDESVEAPAVDQPTENGQYCWSWAPEIRRTVIANDKIYTVSDAGVKITDLTTFEARGWLPFAE